MKLRVFKYNDEIQELELTPGTTYKVGRKEDCDVLLEKLPGISRTHFEISHDGSEWRVNCISEIKYLDYNGEERKDFVLSGKGEFHLDPYKFRFEEEAGAMAAPSQAEASVIEDSVMDEANLAPIDNEFNDLEAADEESFAGNDEKTAIQSFNGLPYIKIIGQDGKKSEYFRLEGNLWVIGGHESASVYIREPSAAQNHFEISKTDKGYFLVDSGSPQGTDLNGQKMTAKKPTRLLSGDIMTVGSTSLQFELRDKAFKRKVSNIPLNMYKNPLVFFDQDVAMVSLDDQVDGSGSAEEIIEEQKKKGNSNPLRTALIGMVACIVLFAGYQEYVLKPQAERAKSAENADPFSQLSPAEQKIVMRTYKLANQLYLDKNYELALVQIDKLHQIIPVYKKSREMEEFCINARDVQRQKALIAQQRKEQEMLEAQVNSAISQCERQYQRSDDVDGVKSCLVPAQDLDPNNPRIAQLITEVTARFEEKKIREKMAAEAAEKVARGRELYNRARNLHKKNQVHKAIEAYENHIHSGLPDPRRLVKKSKRYLATIEKGIKNKKVALMSQAQSKYSTTYLRDAIRLARKAQKVDPYDPEISAFLYQVEKELSGKMKAIYMDSVIEERFGNTEASRVKWEEILKKDIEDGEYYRKAKRKMKFYGFEFKN